MPLLLGALVGWGGYTLLVYGVSQVAGCNIGLRDLAWPGRTIACNPDSGTNGTNASTASPATGNSSTPNANTPNSSRVEQAAPGKAASGTPAGPTTANLGAGSGQATIPESQPKGTTTPPAPTF